ncbi:OLC1v1003485C2 [Oldenlandia corymbosa var. corymbosa]|uniref:HECT-type E3 ubiquitin transferase n=1 Tax=Oldenlandia corymbosa var. corymbosa TaxID=529605 RepID=A0AAV1DA62_OLDCO|nr:OLC1v1003485C2 [Oldenlandia corymbosa var. corymbosa]
METRSRKRVEATSSAPSSSTSSGPTTRATKRARLSSSSSSSAATAVTAPPPAPTTTTTTKSSSISTRSRAVKIRSKDPKMDPTNESSGSGSGTTRSRRGRNPNHHAATAEKDNNNSDKGKEKEHDVRIRERERVLEAERSLGLNIDSSGGGNGEDDDNDNDSDGNVGILHQNLTSASSALQGLLRKLGAGLDDLLPSSAMAVGSGSGSHQSGRLKKILSGLRADGEEGKQVEALTQLCDMLSIGTEESLSTFSVDSFVPVLVGLLNHESNADIMLLAARALTHLVDVLPSSTAAVVHYGAVSCFVARLLTIEYMDLAEQSLQALKKISQEHPTACLRAGALMAVLSYLDFFSTGVQRVALATAANMCRKLPSDAADFVMEAVPLLTNLLQYHDSKVLEHASICLTRIAEAFASSPDKLDELCNHGLVTQAASLISTSNSGQASLSTSTYTGLIRLLSTCASGSNLGAKTLLLLGVSGILKDILSGSGLVAGMSVSPALSRPPDQVFEIMNLANELLPPLPQGTISLPASYNLFIKGPLAKKPSGSSSVKQEDLSGNSQEVSPREKLLLEQPELLQQFGIDLLPVLIQIYGSSVNGPVRYKCLSVIGKLMYFSTADMIQSLLSVTNISSFLAGVLAWKDPQVLVPALQIAEILMEKLPETFSKMFIREGVVHAIEALIIAGSPCVTPQLQSSIEKDNDSISGSSSRPRRNRRRVGASNADGDDVKNPSSAFGSPPNSADTPLANSGIRATVSARAKAFRGKYFPSDPDAIDTGITDDLLHLKNLCVKLNAGTDEQKTKTKGKSKSLAIRLPDLSASREKDLAGVVADILGELGKGDGVSTFEFIGSGVVKALLNYFTCGYFSKDKVSEADLSKLRQQAIRRYKSFVAVALPSSGNAGNTVPMSLLIQKLQNALSSLERFPVVLSHTSRSSGGNSRPSSGLSALAQPFKLRLCRAQGEKSLRDYSSNVVLIDPLASLAAVEDFLWPRIQRSDSGQKSSGSTANADAGTPHAGVAAPTPSSSTPASTARRHSTRSRSALNIGDASKKETTDKGASSSKGKGKAVLKPASEEGRGPQTRNAARRRAALDKDAQMKPVNGDTSSEDEDLDISPVEIDDALVIEDDDISDDDDDDQDDVLGDDSIPVCMPEKVHDVKLGDAVEDASGATSALDGQMNQAVGSSSRAPSVGASDSADFRSGASYGSRGAMSFAAAAMAGLASGNARGARGARDRHGRLLFGSSDPARLIFSSGGKQLNRHLTIYQAIQRQLVLEEDDDERYGGGDFVSSDGSRLWTDIYTITYHRAESQSENSSVGTPSSGNPSKSSKASSSATVSTEQVSLLDSILQGELPCDLEKNNPTYDILALLRVLEVLNQLAPRLRIQAVVDDFSEGKLAILDALNANGTKVPSEEFINNKLTPKLARQIQDALALCSGALPSWCYQLTKACPFLFPFETRRQYFYSTAFGLSRALYRLQQQQGADGHGSTNEREVRVGRLQRQKVRVSRNRILDSAVKVMEMYSSQKAVLEVEYFGEVGTGLGPTLEFYTLLSHDLQKNKLGMWISTASERSSMDVDVDMDGKTNDVSSADRDLVHAPLGLFPRPWPPTADTSDGSQFSKVVEYFRLLGRVMAKALQDGRLMDLPLSTAFYKLVLGQELDLEDIISFDATFGKTLQELQALVCRKRYLESMTGPSQVQISDLRFQGTSVEDLCLDFTLPGHPEYVLKSGDENVNLNNLEDYLSLVVDATVRAGIRRQMEAFRSGFNQVFDISTLQIFSPDELDYLLCGRREMWKAETLADHIKFDHGYTAKSPAIINLLEIMGEFSPEQQRAFCQFVTGAPRLPPGGLAVLNPKLTIVRKHSSIPSNAMNNAAGASESADEDLPSVMTCANYLKLPPYSTKEIMYKKLLYAINEGQGSFDLS